MRKNFDNIIAFTLSTIGSLFLVYYIFRGSTDVVSSDYIRIINYYIDDVTDLKYLLSWESISRIPFTFLARFINVKCFHYSVFFDRILGILGLFIFNFTLIKYIFKKYVLDIIKVTLSIIVTLISFSLMSWEMILNGTGYPHFITVGLIAITFYNFESITGKINFGKKTFIKDFLFDFLFIVYGLSNYLLVFLARYIFVRDEYGMSSRYAIQYMFLTIGIILILSKFIDFALQEFFSVNNVAKANDKIKDEAINKMDEEEFKINDIKESKTIIFKFLPLYILISFTSLLFAGSYAVSYICTLILFSFLMPIIYIIEGKNIESSKTNSDVAKENIKTKNDYVKVFIPYFILIILSIVCLMCYFKSNSVGETLAIVGAKDITLIELLKDDLTFPIRFLLKSLASSIIGVETFDYAINFGTITEKIIFLYGILYILIILFTIFIIFYMILYHNKKNMNEAKIKNIIVDDISSKKEDVVNRKEDFIISNRTKWRKVFLILISVLCIGVFLIGHLATTTDEIFKADYRKIIYTNLEGVAKDFRNYSDEELMNFFEYRRDPNHIKEALETLERQKLNIFYEGR